MTEEKKDLKAPLMNSAPASAAAIGWSDEDRAWLDKYVPEMLITVAIRHGRPLFTLVMQAGAASHAFDILSGNAPKRFQPPIAMLQRTMEDMMQKLLKAEGFSPEKFQECKADIERAVALASGGKPQGGNVSPGGIILNS